MAADMQAEATQIQQQLRVVMAMTTLFLCCLATAPCGYVLLNFNKFHFRPKTSFCTCMVVALDMLHCCLLLFFNVPTQLKGLWLFGQPACHMQAFLTRVLKGGSYIAIIILAMQGCCSGAWFTGCSTVMRHTKLLYCFVWAVVGSVSILPFVLDGPKYTFDVSLSYCDVGRGFFVTHDIITYCLPAVLLSVLSVRLSVCMHHQSSSSTSGSYCSNNECVDDILPEDCATQSMVADTGVTWEKEASFLASRRALGRGPLDHKSTMTICFLSTESLLLTVVEVCFRLFGVLLPSPSLLACSVLFACAGYIVRSTTIIIVERTYRCSSIFTSSSTVVDEDTMTSRAHQHHQMKHKHSFSDLDNNRARRQRHEKHPARPCTGSRLSNDIEDRCSEYRCHLGTCNTGSQMIAGSGITTLSSKLPFSSNHEVLTSQSNDCLLGAASSTSASCQSTAEDWDGVRLRSSYSHFLSENARREPVRCRMSYVNCINCAGTGTTVVDTKRKILPRTLFARLSKNRQHVPVNFPTQVQEVDTPLMDQTRGGWHSNESKRMQFFQKPMKTLDISRFCQDDDRNQFDTEKRISPLSSGTSLVANLRKVPRSGMEHAPLHADTRASFRTLIQPRRNAVKSSKSFGARAKRRKKKSREEEHSVSSFHAGEPLTNTVNSSRFHTVATEDSQWDGSPETLSPLWLTSPCVKPGRIQRKARQKPCRTSDA